MLSGAGDKCAVVSGDLQITYSQLKQNILVYSDLYKNHNAKRVAIFSENSLGWMYAFYSGWHNKATMVPIDFMATEEEVTFILSDCVPEVVFVSKNKLADLNLSLVKANLTPLVIVIEDVPLPDNYELDYVFSNEEHEDEKTAVIIYTSGTTGSPKGVMLSFKNLMANVNAVSKHLPIYNERDVVLMLLPLHHIFPLAGTLILPLSTGATIAMSPSMVSEDIISTLQKNKVSIIIGVPRLYAAIRKGIKDKINKSLVATLLFKLARVIDSRTFSRKVFNTVHQKFGGNVKFMVCGGAALDTEVGQDFKTLGFEVLEGFGMTEASPMITFTRPNHVKVGSPGQRLVDTQVEIRDGEIVAKGPNIMQGYYNRPVETAEVIKDGWLYTGDLGYFDKDGFLFVTGRRKEIIVLSSGKNINPSEVEAKLLSFSSLIKEVGVYENKDQLRAIVVINSEETADSKDDFESIIKIEVIEKYNASAAPYKKVMGFVLCNEELPRTRLGKVQRFKLIELGRVNAFSLKKGQDEPTFEEYKIIKSYLEQEKKCKVFPGDHLEVDLGLDSLDKVGFQVFLQSSFGVQIQPDELVKLGSVQDISVYVKENLTHIEVETINWSMIFKQRVSISLPGTWLSGLFFVKLSKLFFLLYFRLKAKGLANIPSGPCIIAPNHQSFFDGLFVASFLKRSKIRDTYIYAKEKHVKSPWLKYLASRHHIIIMDLNKDLKESIQKLGEALRQNKTLIIFPEGTRSQDGQLGDFKRTFAILSQELNVPIVPVSIKGASMALPKGSIFPRP